MINCPSCNTEGAIKTKCKGCHLFLSEQLLTKKKFCDKCGFALTDGNCYNEYGCQINCDVKCCYCFRQNVTEYTCECYHSRLYRLNTTMTIGKSLLEWLRNPFKSLIDTEIVSLLACFEEVFVRWQKISYWFRFEDLSTNTEIPVERIKTIINKCENKPIIFGDSLRMTKVDMWILQDVTLSLIIYAHLRIILKDFL